MIRFPTNYCTQPEILASDEKENKNPSRILRGAYYSDNESDDFNLNMAITIKLTHEYQIDAQKIQARYPGGLASEEHIDLSHLGLKHLPSHIVLGCLKAKRLDISGNNIHWLPEQLKELGLEILDISGNQRLQPNLEKFSWLLGMTGLNLIANDMGFDFIPRGWNGRFESNQVSTEYEWMSCSTQVDEDCS